MVFPRVKSRINVVVRREIEATTIGHFAIHNQVLDDGFARDYFTLTHVETGLAIKESSNELHLEELADTLNAMPIDWDIDFAGVTSFWRDQKLGAVKDLMRYG